MKRRRTGSGARPQLVLPLRQAVDWLCLTVRQKIQPERPILLHGRCWESAAPPEKRRSRFRTPSQGTGSPVPRLRTCPQIPISSMSLSPRRRPQSVLGGSVLGGRLLQSRAATVGRCCAPPVALMDRPRAGPPASLSPPKPARPTPTGPTGKRQVRFNITIASPTVVSHLSVMKPVVGREFVREFPRFVARAREGEVIEIRHRDGALFTFALKSGGRPRPRKAATPLDPKAFAQVDLDSPAFPPLPPDARLA